MNFDSKIMCLILLCSLCSCSAMETNKVANHALIKGTIETSPSNDMSTEQIISAPFPFYDQIRDCRLDKLAPSFCTTVLEQAKLLYQQLWLPSSSPREKQIAMGIMQMLTVSLEQLPNVIITHEAIKK